MYKEFEIIGKTFVVEIKQKIHQFVLKQLRNTVEEYSPLSGGSKFIGLTAIVTGGHKGIGLSITKALLREGANVIITGRNKKALIDTCNTLQNERLKYIVWDISDVANCDKNFDIALRLFGKIDMLVNNAGVNKFNGKVTPFMQINEESLRGINDINVIGTKILCESFAHKYKKGAILNIISNTAILSPLGVYWLSKWAIYSFTKKFGEVCRQKGLNVVCNGICPGPTTTDMMKDYSSNIIFESSLNKRFSIPEEIAELAIMVLYSSLYGLNGKILIADGGQTIK